MKMTNINPYLNVLFDAAAFQVHIDWWKFIWGGGHTTETDPTRKGWRAKKIVNTGDPARGIPPCILVGRAGVKGCFSAMLLSPQEPGGDALLDVAYYTEETPEQIAKVMREKGVYDPIYEPSRNSPGWGLAAIERLNTLIEHEKHW